MSVPRSPMAARWSPDSNVPVASCPVPHYQWDQPKESCSSESGSENEAPTRFREPTPTCCPPPAHMPMKLNANSVTNSNSLTSSQIALWSVAALTFATVSALWYNHNTTPPKCDLILDDEMEVLKSQFHYLKEDDWLVLAAGLEAVRDHEPHRPSTFIFAYQNNSTAAEHLADTVASLATKFLSDCRMSRPIKLRGSAISDNLIYQFKDKLDRTHVMVVNGLELMDAETASPFHSLCDEYNPIVGKSAFFFTLQLDLADGRYSASKLVKKRLTDLWKTSRDALVSGLVTRLTNNVIEIHE